MSINVDVKKVVIAVLLIVVFCGGIAWFMETAPKRKVKAEIKVLVDFAQRQALEIAIIEQSVKLAQYKRQIAKSPVSPVEPKEPVSKETE